MLSHSVGIGPVAERPANDALKLLRFDQGGFEHWDSYRCEKSPTLLVPCNNPV